MLGLGTPARVAERLDPDEVSQTHITDSMGRQQETTINQPNGSVRITRTVKVTGKGQQHFINLFLADAS